MAEKVSTLILKVDLGCRSCYKKIRKILCKLQDKERIWTISYDDGGNLIAVVGAFDPHKLSCKIRCMGGKVIKGIDIMHDGGGGGGGGKPSNMAGPPPMTSGGKKKHKEKAKEMDRTPPAEPEQQQQQPPLQPPSPQAEKPPAAPQLAPPDSHMSAGMTAMIEEEKPRERPAEVEYATVEIQEPPAAAPVEIKEMPRACLPPPGPRPVWPVAEVTITPTVEIPSWPAPAPAAGPCGCSCCQPCYQGYYEGCRCYSCGRVYGYSAAVVPPAGYYYGGGYRPRCQAFCDDDPAPACTIM